MLIQTARNLTRPRFTYTPGGRPEVVNTTGDRIDPATSVILPKAGAVEGKDPQGRVHFQVVHGGQEHWIPKESFTETDGESGVYYLPTYQSSPSSAALGGGVKAMVALGPFAGGAAAGAGYLAHRFGKNTPAKLALGAGIGAVGLTALNTAIFGTRGLPLSLLMGAAAGVAAVHAGEGEAKLRDASYGGGIAGFAAGAITGNPAAMLTGSAAAGLGARARSPFMRAVVGGAVGAALGAGQALLTGGSVGLLTAITAATGAVGPLIGPPVMQVTRNLSHLGGEVVASQLKNSSDTTLKVAGAIPYAAGFGFLGATAGSLYPGIGTIGATVGAVGGAAFGYWKTGQQLQGKP